MIQPFDINKFRAELAEMCGLPGRGPAEELHLKIFAMVVLLEA
jgi:hypothetical protein